jgi:hypothetical protein
MNSIFPAKRRVSSSLFTVLMLHPKWVAMQVERSFPPSPSNSKIR